MIRIVDFGSQLTQNIARRIREQGVFTEIVPFHTSIDKIKSKDLEGLVLSGGQFSVYDEGSPKCNPEVFSLGVPILGICYGQQSIAHMLGGKVSPTPHREYGGTNVVIQRESKLFDGIDKKEFKVWMSHGDIVDSIPAGFEILARSENGHVAAMEGNDVYAVQFHPEADDTEYGRKILGNFLSICGAERTWDPEKSYERIVDELTEKLVGRVGIGGISGGVDSSTMSVLVSKIAGSNYHPIFVDNGLLRLNEAEQVMKSLFPFGLNIRYADASERFLKKLEGITDPEKKRKVIGKEFIDVFEEEALKIPGVSYLAQGTLYPDVIESVPLYGASSVIKSHHNVGGLPKKLEELGWEIIEPFRYMFKDEVRKLAETKLMMPKEIVWRHPFPGPGLAIRIEGEVTKAKLEILREADHIYETELKARGLYHKISQAFAGLKNSQSVGVMGDKGTYQYEIRLRAVVTKDFMTADIYHFDWTDLKAISNRIVNEVWGVNSVAYTTTTKPPATIEWG